jgi:hypothetical protein
MDIARAFSDSGVAQGVTINIQGTPDDPLFQANQIGALLGLVNIRETIKDFDEDELRVSRSSFSRGMRALFGASMKRPIGDPMESRGVSLGDVHVHVHVHVHER